jgi:hypothetical protein
MTNDDKTSARDSVARSNNRQNTDVERDSNRSHVHEREGRAHEHIPRGPRLPRAEVNEREDRPPESPEQRRWAGRAHIV